MHALTIKTNVQTKSYIVQKCSQLLNLVFITEELVLQTRTKKGTEMGEAEWKSMGLQTTASKLRLKM